MSGRTIMSRAILIEGSLLLIPSRPGRPDLLQPWPFFCFERLQDVLSRHQDIGLQVIFKPYMANDFRELVGKTCRSRVCLGLFNIGVHVETTHGRRPRGFVPGLTWRVL